LADAGIGDTDRATPILSLADATAGKRAATE